MTRPPIAALLWDVDGTLVDSEPLHARATDLALEELGMATPEGFHARSLGLSAERMHRLLVEETGSTVGAATWEALKWQYYMALATGLAVRQPAARLVAEPEGRGWLQVVVSNSARAEVDLALRVTGLAPHFACSLARDDVTNPKPDPEGYLRASEVLGVVPETCLVIEDSLTGAEAGRRARMRVVFHPPHDVTEPAELMNLSPDGDLSSLMRSLLTPTRSPA